MGDAFSVPFILSCCFSINGCLQWKNQFENKIDWFDSDVWVQRIGAIQVDPILIPSSFSIKKKKKGGSARSVGWAFRFGIMP